VVALGACRKDPKIEAPPVVRADSSVVTFAFKAKVKNEDLVPDTKFFTNPSKDNYSVSKFNYYISNVRFTRKDGFVYSEPESYHLMEHVQNKTRFSIKGMPDGEYTKIEFMIGVDSLRNVKGAQTGALDPAHNMFWDWDQGYIFFKLEGSFNTLTQQDMGDYAIHIGGFAGPYATQQQCSFSLLTPVSVKGGHTSSIYYNVQVDEIFVKPSLIGFDTYYNHISDSMFQAISINYKDMFLVDKVEN
jgi:hypothetical protein